MLYENSLLIQAVDACFLVLTDIFWRLYNPVMSSVQVFRYNLIVPFGRQMFGLKWEKELKSVEQT